MTKNLLTLPSVKKYEDNRSCVQTVTVSNVISTDTAMLCEKQKVYKVQRVKAGFEVCWYFLSDVAVLSFFMVQLGSQHTT